MTAPADRLREAAGVVRPYGMTIGWAIAAGATPEVLQVPAQYPINGEALAMLLEEIAERLAAATHPDWQETAQPNAIALADSILAAVSR